MCWTLRGDSTGVAWRRPYEYLRLYDAVLIYGSRQIYAAESAYQLTPYAPQVIYCNYVVPRMRTEVPLNGSDAPFILVMGGGGKAAFPSPIPS